MWRRVLIVLALACAAATALSPAFAITAGEARTTSFKLQSEGMRLYKEGKYKEAIEAFRQVVNINLNSFMAHYYYGICLNADRRYGEAIEPLKIALDLQPDYVQAHLALGDAHLKGGDAGEARAEYLRALELQPNYAPAFDGLGRLFESTGQDDQAEAQYRKALEINVAFADAYTHLGDLFLRRGRDDDAIDLFLKAISVKPDFSSAYLRLGVAYSRRRLYDDAIATIRKSQALAPQDPEPYVSLARIYLELESPVRAEAEIQAALAQDHDHPGAHMVLSDLKRSREDFAAAVEVLEGLHERGIEDALMRRAVGEALQRVRADALRHASLKEAAEKEPEDAGALSDLARFLSGQGAHRRAADLLERAAANLSESGGAAASIAEARYQAGLEMLAARLHPRAIATFEGLASSAAGGPAPPPPEDGRSAAILSSALFNLGVARAWLRLDEPAIEAFLAYLKDRPEDARAHLYLGNAYLRVGRGEEARAAYASFLERSGSGPEAERVRRLIQTLGPRSQEDGKRAAGGAEGKP
jgi:tetratricopeptide (TPR) repeat protein